MKTVLIFSGGLDSTTLLYETLAAGQDVLAIGIDYGQRHVKELQAATRITEALNVPYQVVNLSALQPVIAGSSQTSVEIDVPEGHYAAENMKLTVVPNRNMIMLSVAVGYAISQKADAIAYAAHGGDHAIYPDCRKEFVDCLAKAVELADWHRVALMAPYTEIDKAEIVRRGAALGVDYGATWSCYKGQEKHCGKCGTCVERKEAFGLAGVSDPTEYEA
jgi:7-cyano-7-deazaguanine synthase